MQTDIRPSRGAAHIKGQLAIIAILITALLAAIIFSSSYDTAAAPPLRVDFASGPSAYCAVTALTGSNPEYNIALNYGADEIAASFNDGSLDAALLPAACVEALDENEYTVLAVTSYLNLVAVENGGTVISLEGLSGHTLAIPESVRNTPELIMLNALLLKAGISADFDFEPVETIRQIAQKGEFDILMLPVEQSAEVLLSDSAYRSCFNLANQWSLIMQMQPPAGSCFVVRNACIAEKREAVTGLLAMIKESVAFINTHHQKAVTLLAANGFQDDPAYIAKTISHCMFVFLEGSEMEDSIIQLSSLLRDAPPTYNPCQKND
jgi:ABC-type nitrate/sulfonate/bicarbonate transport system substrate-binding protein